MFKSLNNEVKASSSIRCSVIANKLSGFKGVGLGCLRSLYGWIDKNRSLPEKKALRDRPSTRFRILRRVRNSFNAVNSLKLNKQIRVKKYLCILRTGKKMLFRGLHHKRHSILNDVYKEWILQKKWFIRKKKQVSEGFRFSFLKRLDW